MAQDILRTSLIALQKKEKLSMRERLLTSVKSTASKAKETAAQIQAARKERAVRDFTTSHSPPHALLPYKQTLMTNIHAHILVACAAHSTILSFI